MTMKAASALFPVALLASAGLLAPVAHARTPEAAHGAPRSIVLDSSLFDWTSTPWAFFRIVPAE